MGVASGRVATPRCYFEAALAEGGSAEARLGLGTALWWLGEYGASLHERERAFVGFRLQGDHMSRQASWRCWLSIAYQAGYGAPRRGAGVAGTRR